MSVRLVISFSAASGKGSELLALLVERCVDVATEPGCEQFEVFRSGVDPDALVLLEKWRDQAALDVHAQVNKTRTPIPRELFASASEREDYVFNRTR